MASTFGGVVHRYRGEPQQLARGLPVARQHGDVVPLVQPAQRLEPLVDLVEVLRLVDEVDRDLDGAVGHRRALGQLGPHHATGPQQAARHR